MGCFHSKKKVSVATEQNTEKNDSQCNPQQENEHGRPVSASIVTPHVDQYPRSIQNAPPFLPEHEYIQMKNENEKKTRKTQVEELKCADGEENSSNIYRESSSIPESEHKQKKKKKKKKDKTTTTKVEEFKFTEEEHNGKHLENELAKLKEENEELKKEKDGLLTRLSAVASAKLTDGNANIADLSDVNRPTNLAEQYSELYDNEWTDAFDVLSKKGETEENICRILLESFCFIYRTCFEKAMGELDCTIDGIKAFLGDEEPPVEVMKQLKDKRKKNAIELVKNKTFKQKFKKGLQKILQSELQHKNKNIKPFIDKGIKLCWLMVVQDPPVFVDININRCDEIYNSTVHKTYTKSGAYIDYIVWPSLYLHKDGHILCKGIAQCKDKTSNINSNVQTISEENDKEKIKNTNLATVFGDDENLKSSRSKVAKKNSLGTKIKNKGGKGQVKQACGDMDQTKPNEVLYQHDCNESRHIETSDTDAFETLQQTNVNTSRNRKNKHKEAKNNKENINSETGDNAQIGHKQENENYDTRF